MVEGIRKTAVPALLLLLTAARAQPQPSPPLPLDPLTTQEREIAASVARADPRVRAALGTGRSRQIYADFISVKRTEESSPQREPSGRYADVLFYRYDGDVGVRALVDLQAKSVVDVNRVKGQSVPINGEEVEEAARLALANANVVRLFDGKVPSFKVATAPATREDVDSARIEGLRTVATSPKDPCFRHRCIVLFFRVNNRYVHLNRVVVDLTSQSVRVSGGAK